MTKEESDIFVLYASIASFNQILLQKVTNKKLDL
jgi:hypothetical protein